VNKTKIEWTDYVWNPVRGCLHNCPYCYGKRIDRRFSDGSFTPTFHPERLQEPLKVKKPSRIFVGSMADLFGKWDWVDKSGGFVAYSANVINSILNIADQCPQHTFIFLTKNPKGMQGFDFPDNCWCGTSVENQEKADERIPELLRVDCKTLFVSYEPALGPIDLTDITLPDEYQPRHVMLPSLNGYKINALIDDDDHLYQSEKHIDWLIIGAQTGPGAVRPNQDWISSAINQARDANIPVFVKDNVNWFSKIQEWPEGVKSCE
jgi:protein gp37